MRHIYYLSTCDTCKKIMQMICTERFELYDIKQKHIEESILDMVAKKSGSYKFLLNTRAQKLKKLTPEQLPVTESDFRSLILSDYTFLKRPLIIFDDLIFAGNDKATIAKLVSLFGK